MRCVACNKNLSDSESTRKSVATGEYLDLCDTCLESIEEDVVYIQGTGGENGETRTESEEDEERSSFFPGMCSDDRE